MAETTTLEQKEQRIIDALGTQPGHWFTRAELAKAMGVKYVNAAYYVVIEILAQRGVIESRSVVTDAPSGKRWEYRIKAA